MHAWWFTCYAQQAVAAVWLQFPEGPRLSHKFWTTCPGCGTLVLFTGGPSPVQPSLSIVYYAPLAIHSDSLVPKLFHLVPLCNILSLRRHDKDNIFALEGLEMPMAPCNTRASTPDWLINTIDPLIGGLCWNNLAEPWMHGCSPMWCTYDLPWISLIQGFLINKSLVDFSFEGICLAARLQGSCIAFLADPCCIFNLFPVHVKECLHVTTGILE